MIGPCGRAERRPVGSMLGINQRHIFEIFSRKPINVNREIVDLQAAGRCGSMSR